jgi:hypothetical protein
MGLPLFLTKQLHLVSGRFFGKWLPAWARLGPLSMGGLFSVLRALAPLAATVTRLAWAC